MPLPSKASKLLDAIGNTRMVELKRLGEPDRVRVMVKLEGDNPAGSVKDRPALWMIREALRRGDLTPEKTVLEPTSGNTGIGIAMVCANLGIKAKLVMPAGVSVERRQVMAAYGAELVLSPAEEKTDGAIRLAHRILEQDPDRYYMPNQFANPDNWRSHYHTTAPEILEQCGGPPTAFVAGLGTTGTIMGCSRRLKEADEKVLIVAAEPTLGHAIQGLKNMKEAIVPEIYEPHRLDRTVEVKDEDAFETARRLAREEGIFCGMSSGASVWTALRVALELPAGSTVVAIAPDRGDRYLSTGLFGN